MSVNAFEILIKSFQTVKRRVNNFRDYPYTNIISNVAMLRERERERERENNACQSDKLWVMNLLSCKSTLKNHSAN